jgi:fructose-specific phosphotransferase system IIC component
VTVGSVVGAGFALDLAVDRFALAGFAGAFVAAFFAGLTVQALGWLWS